MELTPIGRNLNAAEPLAAIGAHHFGAQKDARPCPLSLRHQAGADMAARIDHCRQPHARRHKVGSSAPAIVGCGEDAGTAARRNTEAVDIGADGAGLHHAGPVIAAKGDQPFMRAGRDHRPFGHDLPQALARLMRQRHRADDRATCSSAA